MKWKTYLYKGEVWTSNSRHNTCPPKVNGVFNAKLTIPTGYDISPTYPSNKAYTTKKPLLTYPKYFLISKLNIEQTKKFVFITMQTIA